MRPTVKQMVQLQQVENSTSTVHVGPLHSDSKAGCACFHRGITDHCATMNIFISLPLYPNLVQLTYTLQELKSLSWKRCVRLFGSTFTLFGCRSRCSKKVINLPGSLCSLQPEELATLLKTMLSMRNYTATVLEFTEERGSGETA